MESNNGNTLKDNLILSDKKTRQWKEKEIIFPWGVITGKWWGPENVQPIIAIHGWQDNAGSFDTLCLLLPDHIPIWCLDMPGHGLSSHLPEGMSYNIYMEDLRQLRKIIMDYGWQKVTLMGHSMGGALSFLYAAVFPNDVEKIILLDIVSPPIFKISAYYNMLTTKIDNSLKLEKIKPDDQPSFTRSDMIEVLHDAQSGSITRESAIILLKRGSKPSGGYNQYKFTRDIRLRLANASCFTIDQALYYASCIKCEILIILADDPSKSEEKKENEKKLIDVLRNSSRRLSVHHIVGTHHLHLNTPEKIHTLIDDFLE